MRKSLAQVAKASSSPATPMIEIRACEEAGIAVTLPKPLFPAGQTDPRLCEKSNRCYDSDFSTQPGPHRVISLLRRTYVT
jgi:hypothetical protein